MKIIGRNESAKSKGSCIQEGAVKNDSRAFMIKEME